MLSNIPAVQPWLAQFLPQDRPTACKLLDELVVIPTDRVVSDLKIVVELILTQYKKAAIYPIRELLSDNESYFSLSDNTEPPTMQHAQATLGSEALVSNLITRLNRTYQDKVVLEDILLPNGNLKASPSISTIKNKKIKTLIIIDDLIGSGDRTCDFLDAIYQHPTIKSWVSGKHLKINVVVFMATDKGKKKVEKWCKNGKKADLHVINSCPSFHSSIDSKEIFDLCNQYANRNERLPLGYDKVAVRVIFGHSAPNNIPAILYRTAKKYKPKSTLIGVYPASWTPLFPRRDVPEEIKHQINLKKKTVSKKASVQRLLKQLEQTPSISKSKLHQILDWSMADLKCFISFCEQFDMLTINSNEVKITEQGQIELKVLNKKQYTIEFNKENYYPNKLE
ncbi:hypothetical protein GLP30_17065 [Photobacterium phosphoreum]|uniref:PRTase-CE domain-containing protein n=1 Tax=Photobacterium phosphoreum TaxID=659 RepID=A0AAW4ZQF4_PHOPO|nr:hypothetical protein [Photobacterium phosphoreum]MCD9492636.1 hypothetical protein [Photobacterium phosphoreum]MCF2191799.1 hypothetical protein [Photobacterium phosphoreum]MCF2303467.1 hypothetical protein [Photobacterium phosphoreum]